MVVKKQKQRVFTFRRFLLLYLIVLGVSHLIRLFQPDQSPYLDGQFFVDAYEMDGKKQMENKVSMAYLDIPANKPDAPTLVILHGSPVASSSLEPIVNNLRGQFRLIVPDLPGFGGSTRTIHDYSIRAHAYYLNQLMTQLEINEFHLAGYSMGGGVAIEYVNAFPEEVKSIQLVSSIGVQELELLGDYLINHAVHGAQLGGLWILQECVPHFGWMDNAILNVPYARNFFDTNQRPLRGFLEELEVPTLILHAEDDPLVPIEAAEEHFRIIPQSELVLLPGSHIFIISKPEITGPPIADFINRTEEGDTRTRAQALPNRLQKAEEAFLYPARTVEGIGLVVLWFLLAVATFVSEDLTSISAGILVAKGVVSFALATSACLIGIFVGDMLLYLAGKFLGRDFVRKAPLKWFISETDILRSSQWFEKRGFALIFITRFFPGTRLATYFTAGVLGVNFWRFSFYFLCAAILWTPLLVGASTLLGGQMLEWFEVYQDFALLGLAGSVFSLLVLLKFIVPLFSYRGRRLLWGKWLRLTCWEFWPLWKVYPPIILYVVWLGLKQRCLTWFTATNPGMPMSGLVLESKQQILNALKPAGDVIPPFGVIPHSLALDEKLRCLEILQNEKRLQFPVVFKPDIGERGLGVAIIRSRDEARAYLTISLDDIIVQQYIEGKEYGIFYYRFPNDETGRIFAITDKCFTEVQGDGFKTLEDLILSHERAVAMAPFFIKKYAARLFEVPVKGEKVQLTELGTHSRGSLFLDGSHLATDALAAEIDRISKCYEGFYFGRYDVKVPSETALQLGANLRILELNGITSEATSIYDPKNSLFAAYKVIFKQWKIASRIVTQNRIAGVRPATLFQVLRQYLDYKNKVKVEV